MKKRMIPALMPVLISVVIASSGALLEARAAEAESPFKPLSKEVLAVLENSEKFILLSIKPSPQEENDKRESFYGHRVLGKLEIKDSAVKKKLLIVLNRSVEKGCEKNVIANCFNPRHGIKAIAGTNEVDLLICFECYQIQVIKGKESELTLVTRDPADLFDRTLHEAGIPLAQE